MRWMESQIETRAKYDAEMTERAYAELASSVSDPRRAPVFTVDDIEQADGAAKSCMKYFGVESGAVPEGITPHGADTLFEAFRALGLYRKVQ